MLKSICTSVAALLLVNVEVVGSVKINGEVVFIDKKIVSFTEYVSELEGFNENYLYYATTLDPFRDYNSPGPHELLTVSVRDILFVDMLEFSESELKILGARCNPYRCEIRKADIFLRDARKIGTAFLYVAGNYVLEPVCVECGPGRLRLEYRFSEMKIKQVTFVK